MLCESRCQSVSATAGASGDVSVAVCPGFKTNVALQTTVSMNASGRGRQSSEVTATVGAEAIRTRAAYHEWIHEWKRAIPNQPSLKTPRFTADDEAEAEAFRTEDTS